MLETPVFSTAAVAAPHRRAAEIGQTILASGGNAIEAVVAMAASCAVLLPHLNGLGGDGYFLVREPRGKVHGLDASGPAGSLATIARYRQKGGETIPAIGPDAALTLAGTVAGWALSLDLSKALGGQLPLDMLLADAITLARNGNAVSLTEVRARMDESLLRPGPFADAFLVEGQRARLGDLRRLPRLADTLERLSHAGLRDFYRGDVGREIALDLEQIQSPVSRHDLEQYRARVVAPMSIRLRQATIYQMPPPSQGFAALLAWAMAERSGVRAADNVAYHHNLIEASKRALVWRDRLIGDPYETEPNLMDRLPALAEREAALIDQRRVAPLGSPPRPEGDAVWIGCIDKDGLAVSYAQSLHGPFGSGCLLPKTGILWHNRGAGFSLDSNRPDSLAPGRKPFHALSPGLAVLADQRVLVFGASGVQAQVQLLARHADLGANLAESVAAPRWMVGQSPHETIPMLRIEDGFDSGWAKSLRQLGHPVEEIGSEEVVGQGGMIVKHARNGQVEASHDPRGDGDVMGL